MSPPPSPIHSFLLFLKKIKLNKQNIIRRGREPKETIPLSTEYNLGALLWNPPEAERVPGEGLGWERRKKWGGWRKRVLVFPSGFNFGLSQMLPATELGERDTAGEAEERGRKHRRQGEGLGGKWRKSQSWRKWKFPSPNIVTPTHSLISN